MKITKKGEYALKAVIALSFAYGKRTLSLREISEEEKLPYKFLEQIMTILKKAAIVQSLKGKQGGYSLSKSPKEMMLGEIIRAVEGPLSPLGTAEEIKGRIQKDERHAGLYMALLDVRNAIAEILDRQTLADICEKSLELASSRSAYQMYYI